MHIIQCVEHNAYDTMLRIQCFTNYRVSQKKRPAENDFFYENEPSNYGKSLYASDCKYKLDVVPNDF